MASGYAEPHKIFGTPQPRSHQGTLLTVFGFLVGPIIDYAGIRACLLVCFALGAVARAIIALTTSRTVLVATLLGPAAVAESLGIPVMTIAVKRYTTDENRGFAFALFYTVMNVAAMLCGPLFDMFRKGVPAVADQGSAHQKLNGYRMFMLTGTIYIIVDQPWGHMSRFDSWWFCG